MHHRIAAALIAAFICVASQGMPPARAAERVDWVVLTVTAGASGAVVDADVHGWVRQGDLTRLAEGVGIGGAEPSITVREVKTGRKADLGVSTNGGLGRIGLDPVLQPDHVYPLLYRKRLTLAPTQQASLLAFTAGGSFSSYGSFVTVVSGSATWTQTQGGGSRLILAGSPDDEGTGAVVASAGAGSTWKTVDATAGLAGAMNLAACAACTGQWSAGDDVAASFTVSPAGTDGAPTFAGPAGPWSWDWSGVSTAAIVGAYAPVGDVWHLFRA